MKTTRMRMTGDAIRAGLAALGLHEEERPIAGFAFSMFKEPHAAVAFWREQHGGAEPTKFYLHPRMYVLAE